MASTASRTLLAATLAVISGWCGPVILMSLPLMRLFGLAAIPFVALAGYGEFLAKALVPVLLLLAVPPYAWLIAGGRLTYLSSLLAAAATGFVVWVLMFLPIHGWAWRLDQIDGWSVASSAARILIGATAGGWVFRRVLAGVPHQRTLGESLPMESWRCPSSLRLICGFVAAPPVACLVPYIFDQLPGRTLYTLFDGHPYLRAVAFNYANTSYLILLCCGIPGYLWMRRRRWLHPRHALMSGAVLGVIAVAVEVGLYISIRLRDHAIGFTPSMLWFEFDDYLFTGSIWGFSMAVVFFLIARHEPQRYVPPTMASASISTS